MSFISVASFILIEIAQWMYFEKMGRQGWEGIIPLYNTYVLFEVLYGSGWKMLFTLIPLYNIYVVIKLNIDLAKAFNKSAGFGIGMILLPVVFCSILGFDKTIQKKDTVNS